MSRPPTVAIPPATSHSSLLMVSKLVDPSTDLALTLSLPAC
jgi:hypothetical protein